MGKLKQLRKSVTRHLINIPGWRTKRKIIVFESDDWGAVRMSSEKMLSKLLISGIQVQKCHYVQNDSLASEEDLIRLFGLLSRFKDSQGKSPIITANVIMTNPNFKKILESDFKEYHYEIFTETLEKYPEHKNSFDFWKKGVKEGLFHLQFHGREHIQVKRWMKFLKDSESDTRKAFEAGVFGLSTSVTSEKRKSYLASYDWDDDESRNFVLESIPEGLSLFKSLFGYQSLSAIAPNYVWHKDVEKVLKENGVRYLQGSSVQKSPTLTNDGFKKNRHYTGQKNNLGQIYLVRNCMFEPCSSPNEDWVSKCLHEIQTALFWNKPAIISIHRVNFIGFIKPTNRDTNLKRFERLLKEILRKWPDVEFMTSDQLGEMIENHE